MRASVCVCVILYMRVYTWVFMCMSVAVRMHTYKCECLTCVWVYCVFNQRVCVCALSSILLFNSPYNVLLSLSWRFYQIPSFCLCDLSDRHLITIPYYYCWPHIWPLSLPDDHWPYYVIRASCYAIWRARRCGRQQLIIHCIT